MEISLLSKIILYGDISIMGVFCLLLGYWQLNVFRGRSMDNPDGSKDDWHEQKILYGIAFCDLAIIIPVALIGITLIFFERAIGYYLTGLVSFWFIWVNLAFTLTSIRFHRPRITCSWILVYPFGLLIGLIYFSWSLVHFDIIFKGLN